MHRIVIAGVLAAIVVAGALVIGLAVFGDETHPVVDVPGGSADRGRRLVERYGCAACHTISGVHSTPKHVGPSLDGLAKRRYIAGNLPNTPEGLMRWIEHPQEVEPGTVMPDLGVEPRQARDIAAFLYADR